MIDEVHPRSGTDAWVDSDHPNGNRSSGEKVRLLAGSRRGFVHIPLTNIRGKTVTNAYLIGRVRSGFVGQTVTLLHPMSKWSADTITDEGAPDSDMAEATVLSGTFADGDAVELGFTAYAQAVAAGTTKWRGFEIRTDADTLGESDWYSFDSGEPAWEAVVEYVEEPEEPTNLRPSGDNIGLTEPILTFDPWDLGGSSSSMAALQVQADPDADEVSPAFDSGWVDTESPELDLSTTPFTALTTGDVLRWRVRTKDADDTEGPWSDWTDATTYAAYPTLTVDSPTGGTITDSTPNVAAHMTGETLKKWRVRVLTPAFETLYDSGLRTGTFALEIPFRDPEWFGTAWLGSDRIIAVDDADYLFDIRGWGDVARAEAAGAPSYVRQLVTVTYDDDAGVTAPDSLTVTQEAGGSPRLVFTWHRSTAADAWQILRDGLVVERLEAEDVVGVSGTYTWTDPGASRPYSSHVWSVRAVDDGVRSVKSNEVTVAIRVSGVWLCPEPSSGIDPIKLNGVVSLDSFARADRRAIYQPVGSGVDVDVVWAQEGVSGGFEGTVADETGKTRTVLGSSGDVARIRALAADTTQRPRLVWASESVRCKVRDLAALPHSTFEDAARRHRVTFTFQQDGD